MRKDPLLTLRRLAALALFICAAPSFATPSFNTADEWNAVPTFHAIGLYWAPTGGAAGVTAQVLFRETNGTGAYRQGLDLWYDTRNSEYRGSIVDLKPNTAYDIKLTLSTGYSVFMSSCSVANRCTATWSENFNVPAGWSFTLAAGVQYVDVFASAVTTPTSTVSGNTQTIRVPNAPTGANYTEVTGTAPNNLIDQTNFASHLPCVDIAQGVRYFIVRGLVLKNCQGAGVRIADNVSSLTDHIVIEDNEMSGWGGGTAADPYQEGAVHCAFYHETNDANRANQIVIQRNKIHDPRYNAPDPYAAEGVSFQQCGSNHVLRYNEIYSGANHLSGGLYGEVLNSAASAGLAGSKGFPWADSDIYGNRISDVIDKAIYAAGANRNVRVWGNYMDRVAGGINNSTTAVGPLYVWRNVTNQLAGMTLPSNPDAENRGAFVYGGSDSTSLNGGRAYYFHNTALQPPPLSGFVYPSGAGYDITINGGVTIYNFVSLNNIWQIFRTNSTFVSINTPNLTTAQQQTIMADYDLYNGALSPAGLGAANAETHGMPGQPTYSASFALPSAANGWAGDFSLASNSLGYRAAVPIANFNDNRPDASVNADVGAQQSGTGAMQFGTGYLIARLIATPASGNAPLTVTFDPSGSAPSASIVSYSLDFGDGSAPGSGSAPQSHTYSVGGNYTASLIVTGADGRQASDTKVITVGAVQAQPSQYELYVSVGPDLTVNKAAGETFSFNVQAADNRALSSVKFFVDNVLKFTGTTAPFNYSWTTATTDATGTHAFRAEATDTSGNVAIESRTLTLLSGACNTFVTATTIEQAQPLGIQASCSGTQTVTEVEFYVDGVLQGSDTRAPYTWTLDTSPLAAGSHTVMARGKFAPSGQVDSPVSVTVTAPALTVSMTPSPTVMYDEPITIGANATDGRTLKQVDFFVDGNFMTTLTVPNGSNVFQYPWTAGSASGVGHHTLLVQATDTNNNVLTATRELMATPRTCNLLLGSRRYTVASNDAVYVLPHRVAQGQRITVQGVCSGWATMTRLEFYLNGTLQVSDTSAPFTWTLDTSGLAVGSVNTIATRGVLSNGAVSNDSLTVEIIAP